ncbi:50S ribosomal protein L31 [Spiroplasma clarkii]|uniref:Large ribosomal subunit protein bL31 n=1 Tax=Spiroplasma clarkii TaxID=2139 RepID=A0A1Y0KZF1_9MOLU|nr:50S ribosomal protein L31 [Spiroplasma clarkii]ATX71644.1 50S ribosomal protein L31 [Spiroplasma clarkii]
MPRKDIHPQYFNAKFVCTTCSNEFMSGSTKAEEVRIDTCSNCHPYYTGKQSFANAEGRVEKFKEKFAKKDAKAAEKEAASAAQKALNEQAAKDNK